MTITPVLDPSKKDLCRTFTYLKPELIDEHHCKRLVESLRCLVEPDVEGLGTWYGEIRVAIVINVKRAVDKGEGDRVKRVLDRASIFFGLGLT